MKNAINRKIVPLATLCFLSLLANAQEDTYVAPSGTMYTHPGSEMAIFGNLINDAQGGVNHTNGGKVYLYSRTGAKAVKDGPSAPAFTDNYNSDGAFVRFYDLVTDNTASATASGTAINTNAGNGALNIEQEARVTNTHTFANGMLWTPRGQWKHAFLHYESAGAYSGATDARHIDGYAAKSGSTNFDFPIGDGTRLRASGIVAPAIGTYKSAYFQKNAQNGTTGISGNNASTGPLNGGIMKVNATEFWDIDGTAASNFKLIALNSVAGYSDWGTSTNFADSDPVFIKITGFDPWENLGINTSPATLTDDGAFVTTTATTPDPNYSAYTWASTSLTLPIEILSFTAQKRGEAVSLQWTTASEEGSSHFDVERSADGRNFTFIGRVNAAGSSTAERTYGLDDLIPAKGMNYYRLKLVDVSGIYEYSTVRSVDFKSKQGIVRNIEPNPTTGRLDVQFSEKVTQGTLVISDITGKTTQRMNVSNVDFLQLELVGTPGMYFVRIIGEGISEPALKIIKM
jgi:hypothetical protein